jgi:acetyl esterase/lipase
VHLRVRDLLRKAATPGVDHSKPEPTSETEVPVINADQPDAQPGKGSHSTRQIQLYTTNGLLKHPLVSPVLAYLGGLPPLLVIASDREVLRDEILYMSVLLCYEERWTL